MRPPNMRNTITLTIEKHGPPLTKDEQELFPSVSWTQAVYWWLQLLWSPSTNLRMAMPHWPQLIGFSLAWLTIVTPALAVEDAEEAWEALGKGGQIALIRHGNAPPGFGGDPPGFRLADSTTQRNPEEKGPT